MEQIDIDRRKEKTGTNCGLKRKLVNFMNFTIIKNILNYFVYSIAHLNK